MDALFPGWECSNPTCDHNLSIAAAFTATGVVIERILSGFLTLGLLRGAPTPEVVHRDATVTRVARCVC